jgi:hypothetical protein
MRVLLYLFLPELAREYMDPFFLFLAAAEEGLLLVAFEAGVVDMI